MNNRQIYKKKSENRRRFLATKRMNESPFFPLPFYEDEVNRVFVAPIKKNMGTSGQIEGSTNLQLVSMLHELYQIPVEVVYDGFGKPWIKPQKAFLSISHSNEFLAFILSTSHACGIDIERLRPTLEKIVPRLLHPSEQELLRQVSDPQMALQYLWGAKEAVYKSWGKRGLQFNTDMIVEPFTTTGNDKLILHFQHKGLKRKYSLQAFSFPGNYLVFTTSEEPA